MPGRRLVGSLIVAACASLTMAAGALASPGGPVNPDPEVPEGSARVVNRGEDVAGFKFYVLQAKTTESWPLVSEAQLQLDTGSGWTVAATKRLKLHRPRYGGAYTDDTFLLAKLPESADRVRARLVLPVGAHELELGEPALVRRSGPKLQATAVATGGGFTCAIDLERQVQCWGQGKYGALGHGDRSDSPLPRPVVGLGQVKAISAGEDHACAIRIDNTAWCWGAGGSGQLGRGGRRGSTRPVPVKGLGPVEQISAGAVNTCAITKSRRPFCWGYQGLPPRGDSYRGKVHAAPRKVRGLRRARQISAGDGSSSCAIRMSRRAVCWGDNEFGQLGNGTFRWARKPTPVKRLGRVTAIDTAGENACALGLDGRASCWGDGTFGALGDGTDRHRRIPVKVKGLGPAGSVLAGGMNGCATRTDGHLYCWGEGDSAVLGAGSFRGRPEAGAVPDLGPVESFDLTDQQACAVTAGSEVWCWGENSVGEAGTGTTVVQLKPVRVLAADGR